LKAVHEKSTGPNRETAPRPKNGKQISRDQEGKEVCSTSNFEKTFLKRQEAPRKLKHCLRRKNMACLSNRNKKTFLHKPSRGATKRSGEWVTLRKGGGGYSEPPVCEIKCDA